MRNTGMYHLWSKLSLYDSSLYPHFLPAWGPQLAQEGHSHCHGVALMLLHGSG
jgi:hypothetical protein